MFYTGSRDLSSESTSTFRTRLSAPVPCEGGLGVMVYTWWSSSLPKTSLSWYPAGALSSFSSAPKKGDGDCPAISAGIVVENVEGAKRTLVPSANLGRCSYFTLRRYLDNPSTCPSSRAFTNRQATGSADQAHLDKASLYQHRN